LDAPLQGRGGRREAAGAVSGTVLGEIADAWETDAKFRENISA
jgi:hypothetical protein